MLAKFFRERWADGSNTKAAQLDRLLYWRRRAAREATSPPLLWTEFLSAFVKPKIKSAAGHDDVQQDLIRALPAGNFAPLVIVFDAMERLLHLQGPCSSHPHFRHVHGSSIAKTKDDVKLQGLESWRYIFSCPALQKL